MTFLYPSFLYALGLVAIPVIIHFFNFRRFKKQEFTQVKFLEQASKVKRRFKQVRDLIIMLLRMLAIACLVLAFAHPIPKELPASSQKQSLVSVYLDNSFSMGLQGENGELLAEGKKKVEEITDAFGQNALFQLVTNNPAKRSKSFIEKELFLQSLEDVDLGPLIINEKELNQLQQGDLMANNGNRIQVVISDFQKQNFDLTHNLDSSITPYWIKVNAESESNISIDSAWFEQALFVKDQNARLKVLLTNHSNSEVESRSLTVKINGTQRAIQTFDLQPNETKEIELFYLITSHGWNNVAIEIEDYPIDFDNVIYTTYYVDPIKKVLSVYSDKPNPYISKVYTKDPNFNFQQVQLNSLDAGSIIGNDLIILEDVSTIPSGNLDQIIDFVSKGGNLLLFPSTSVETTDLNTTYKKFGITLSAKSTEQIAIKSLELAHPFFNDIFDEVPKNIEYPKVYKHFKSSLATRSQTESLIGLSNGQSFMYLTNFEQGRVFAFTSALNIEHNTLIKNGIFVPLLYKFASYKGSQSSATFFIDNKPTSINLSQTEKASVLGLFKLDVSQIPNQVYKNGLLTFFEDDITEDGFYEIKSMPNADSTLYQIGLNYNRKESNMSFWSNGEIEEKAEIAGVRLINDTSVNLTAVFKDINDKNRLWRYFLLATFCFLLFEIIAIKLPFK